MWSKSSSNWSNWQYTIYDQIIDLQIVFGIKSIVVIEITVWTVECAKVHLKLQFGWYEQAELCHLLWMDVTVRTVECATANWNKSNCSLDVRCYEQPEFCHLLWNLDWCDFSNCRLCSYKTNLTKLQFGWANLKLNCVLCCEWMWLFSLSSDSFLKTNLLLNK